MTNTTNTPDSKLSSLLTPPSSSLLPPPSSLSSGVSIIILTLNAAPLLKRLLETFHQHNTHAPVELIVVDHGSMDDTAAVVAQFSKRTFIRLRRRGQNYSFAASCNYGAAKASHPYLLFLNNDIVYTEGVLPRAVEVLEKDETMGAVGVRLDDVSEEEGVGRKE